jgi:hypothetical protein
MGIDTEIHKKILINLIDKLIKDYGKNDFLVFSKYQLVRDEITLATIKNILYGVLSFYLVDEITFQPAQKMNLIDMGSYYYRSESYSIDFPHEFHKKYHIPYPHTERKESFFIQIKIL